MVVGDANLITSVNREPLADRLPRGATPYLPIKLRTVRKWHYCPDIHYSCHTWPLPRGQQLPDATDNNSSWQLHISSQVSRCCSCNSSELTMRHPLIHSMGLYRIPPILLAQSSRRSKNTCLCTLRKRRNTTWCSGFKMRSI